MVELAAALSLGVWFACFDGMGFIWCSFCLICLPDCVVAGLVYLCLCVWSHCSFWDWLVGVFGYFCYFVW